MSRDRIEEKRSSEKRPEVEGKVPLWLCYVCFCPISFAAKEAWLLPKMRCDQNIVISAQEGAEHLDSAKQGEVAIIVALDRTRICLTFPLVKTRKS